MHLGASLHDWLRAAELEGDLDSRGEFTIEIGKAWEKLGTFQLPFEHAWVLKLVQAAVATPNCSLDIRQSREETAFIFENTTHWKPSAIEKVIFETSAKSNSEPLEHLAVALRALALNKKRPFSVSYANGVDWVWTGCRFARLNSTKESHATVVRVTHYQFGESNSFLSLGRIQASKFRAEIATTLAQHCHLAPNNITLDKRPLDGCLTDPYFGKTSQSHPLFVVYGKVHEDWEPLKLRHLAKQRAAKIGSYRVSIPAKTSIVPIGPEGCGAAAIVSAFFQKEVIQESMRLDRAYYRPATLQSQTIWICDGVVVKREPLDFFGALGLGALVSAQGLPTDLTSLAPLENEMKSDRLERSLKRIEESLLEVKKSLGPNGFEVSGNKLGVALTGVAGTALLFTIPLVGVAFLAKAGHSYKEIRNEGKQLDLAYDNSFDHLLSFLRHC